MEKFALSTDSCCDEFKSNLAESNIYCLQMDFIDGDIVKKDDFDSLKDYKYFYDEMKCGKSFSTCGINPQQFEEHFLAILEKEKKDLIHVSLSSGLSGTYSQAKKVAEEINKTSKFKVFVLDSLSATQGQNLLVAYAKNLRDEKLSSIDAMEKLIYARNHMNVEFFLTDLEVLKKGGRIGGAQAMIGKLMSLRPLLRFDKEGKLEVFGKVIGSKKAVLTIFNNFVKNRETENKFPVYIPFAGDITDTLLLSHMIEEKLNFHNIITGPLGPLIASHTGPSLTGLIYISKFER